jgi:hypothetical protein
MNAQGFFRVLSVVVFILAAIFLFWVNQISTTTDLGLIAVGLAALAASWVPTLP